VPVTVLLLRTKNHGAFSTLPVAPASSVNCEFCIFFIRGVYCFRVNYHLFELIHTIGHRAWLKSQWREATVCRIMTERL